MTDQLTKAADLIGQQAEQLKRLSTDRLKSILLEALSVSADMVIKAAAAVRVLEDRGVDLSDLGPSAMRWLRMVERGRLLPSAVEGFIRCPLLLGKLSGLRAADQHRLAETRKVEVVVIDGGRVTYQMCDLIQLGRRDLDQVFADDHVRTRAEQQAWLRNRPAAATSTEPIDAEVQVQEDGIRITGPITISWKQLAKLLAARP